MAQIIEWFGTLDLQSLGTDILQFLLLFVMWRRKQSKGKGTTAKQDLTALAEYHEKAAKRLRENLAGGADNGSDRLS